ncbi:MAG: hypothetical protein C0504_05255 [Candidatus Solibacter sp.]|nr:hypothetical protein [Candidatus Solibacter sp.]
MRVIPFGCVVEGQGDVASLPILIERLARVINQEIVVTVRQPVRVKRDRFVSDDREFERGVILASRSAGDGNPVLILLDSEGDCPAELGPRLLGKARAICPGRPVGCVVAHQEYETWFMAAPEAIRDQFKLDKTPIAPQDPESRRGAKEWIKQHLPRGKTYSETTHQHELTKRIDLKKARAIPSFDKLYREVSRLLSEAGAVDTQAR